MKSGGGGMTTLNVFVDSSTGVSVNNGTLVASNSGTWVGSLTTAATTVLRFSGGTHSLSGVTIGGMGRTEVTGGTVNTTGAVIVSAMTTLANSATLGGAGALTVHGTLEWTAGTITGAGMLVVNGMLVLDSGSTKILDTRTLELNGTGQWKSTGSFYLANGAVLHNAASGTFDMQNNAFMGISGAPSTEKFDNDGMLMKSGSGGGMTTLNVFVDSSTGVSVNNGTLVASNSGTWVGSLTTAATTVLRFSGGTHSLSGVTIGGMGRTEVTGGTVNTTGAVTVSPTTTLANSATLGGAGALTVNGTLEWTAGTITGAGMLVVNGMLVLDSGSSKILDGRMLELNGTGQWKSTGSFYLANGAVLHNAASGTFDMQNNAFMGISGATSTEKFDNDGMLMKSGSGGGMTTLNVFVDSSTGVSVNNGTLVASNSGTWVGSLTTAATTVLRFSGGTHSLSGVTIGGMGRTEVTGGTVNTTGAVIVSAMTTLANSATLGGAGALTVHGTLEWTAGTITGAGMLVVNGMLVLDSGSTKILDTRTLELNGTGQWKSTGSFYLANGAVLHNAASGTFDMQNNAFMGISGAPSTEKFDNDGMLMKSGSGGGMTTLNVFVDSSTGVSVNNGTLVASNSGTWVGSLTTAATTVLRFSGGTHSLSGVTIGGMGRTEVTGGTVNTTGAVTVSPTTTLANSATLGGAGALTVHGTLEWTAGTITGAGMLVVNGMLVLDSGSTKILDTRTLELNGTGQWKSTGSFYLANGAVLHNAASGTFDMQNNAFMGISGAPSTEKFDNDGMLMKSGSGGGTTTLNVFVDTSTGVSVNNGTLVASNSGTWVGSLTTAATTVLRFSGGTHSLSGVTIGGMGRTEVTGGTVNTTGAVTVSPTTTLANSATLGGAGALTVNGTLEWTAGTITGAGMLVVNGMLVLDSGSSKILDGRMLELNGTGQWKSTGSFYLANGAVLHNAASGTFDMQNNAFMGISGATSTEKFDNDGMLMKSGSGGGMTTLNVFVDSSTGVSVNNGTLVASNSGTWVGSLTTAATTVLRFSGGTH